MWQRIHHVDTFLMCILGYWYLSIYSYWIFRMKKKKKTKKEAIVRVSSFCFLRCDHRSLWCEVSLKYFLSFIALKFSLSDTMSWCLFCIQDCNWSGPLPRSDAILKTFYWVIFRLNNNVDIPLSIHVYNDSCHLVIPTGQLSLQ